jgi:hypothetical protein
MCAAIVPRSSSPELQVASTQARRSSDSFRSSMRISCARYVHDSSWSARFCSEAASPIKHRREHPAMQQVDVAWRPNGARSGARPVEYQRAAPRFFSAQNWLDFLVGREHALIGLERFRAPSLPSHGLASAARPKDLVDRARDDFRGNIITLNAHRLLNAADHTGSTLGRLPILQ